MVLLQLLPSWEQLCWDNGTTYTSTFPPSVCKAELSWNYLTLENRILFCISYLKTVSAVTIFQKKYMQSYSWIFVVFQTDSKKCKVGNNLFTSWFIILGGTIRFSLIKWWLLSHVYQELIPDLIFWFVCGGFCLLQALTKDVKMWWENCTQKSALFLLGNNHILLCSTGRKRIAVQLCHIFAWRKSFVKWSKAGMTVFWCMLDKKN